MFEYFVSFFFLGEYSCPIDKIQDLVQGYGITFIHVYMVSLNTLPALVVFKKHEYIFCFDYHYLRRLSSSEERQHQRGINHTKVLRNHYHVCLMKWQCKKPVFTFTKPVQLDPWIKDQLGKAPLCKTLLCCYDSYSECYFLSMWQI